MVPMTKLACFQVSPSQLHSISQELTLLELFQPEMEIREDSDT